MSRRGRLILWSLLAAGTLVRVVVAFTTDGVVYDLESCQIVAGALTGPDPFALYRDVNADALRWPYPSGYFPWLAASESASSRLGLDFASLVRLGPIAADAALAWVVQAALGDRGASERTRLAAVGLVTLGPSFAIVSSFEGQIDSVAILPAAAAFLVWQRMPPTPRRAVAAGLLVGCGTAIKTVPVLMLLPLLAVARGRREIGTLVLAAAAVPLVTIAPWLASKAGETVDALGYGGLPGLGGLSLLAQPSLATGWIVTEEFDRSALTDALIDARTLLTVVLLAGVAAFVLRRRPEPLTGALVVWMALFAFGVNFGPRYLVWALPFMLMSGRLRQAAALQAVAFPAAVILAGRPWDGRWLATAYVVLMIALMLAFVALLVALVRSAPAATRRRQPAGS